MVARATLKRLLSRWTIPVSATARSTENQTAKIGVSIVPKPKPEKKLRIETGKALSEIMRALTPTSF
jgi:hypothetical protein